MAVRKMKRTRNQRLKLIKLRLLIKLENMLDKSKPGSTRAKVLNELCKVVDS